MDDTRETPWASYAVGVLNAVDVGDAIVGYVQQIDATLAPYRGRFLVHGGAADQVEGAALGDVVVIAFPAADGAARWYRSAAYQAIVALRAEHSLSQVVLLEGCDASHRAVEVLPALLLSAA